jgi:hypothetical protein
VNDRKRPNCISPLKSPMPLESWKAVTSRGVPIGARRTVRRELMLATQLGKREPMNTNPPILAEQTPTITEQGSAHLAVTQIGEKKVERISEEKLYEENAKVAAIFWEWRHKIMTHFLTGMAAITALVGWLYKQNGFSAWLCTPLLLGAALSHVSYLLDERNKKILEACLHVGSDLERQSEKGNGIYCFINDLHHNTKGSYTRILRTLYRASTYLLLGLSFVIILVAVL